MDDFDKFKLINIGNRLMRELNVRSLKIEDCLMTVTLNETDKDGAFKQINLELL